MEYYEKIFIEYSNSTFSVEAIPMYNLREEALKFHEKGRGNLFQNLNDVPNLGMVKTKSFLKTLNPTLFVAVISGSGNVWGLISQNDFFNSGPVCRILELGKFCTLIFNLS